MRGHYPQAKWPVGDHSLPPGEASTPVGQVQNAAVCHGEQFLGEETLMTPRIGLLGAKEYVL